MEIFSKFFTQKNPPDFYKILGQEEGITKLVERFYFHMEMGIDVTECLNLHDLREGKIQPESKKKLIYFLSGWLGGPQLFVENYGPPMMRKRHLHLKITELEKTQWLLCMERALTELKLKKDHQKTLMNSFTALGMRIVNH